MLIKIFKTLVFLLIIIKNVSTFEIHLKNYAENVLEKLLMDPDFIVNDIAVWSINQKSQLQKNCVNVIVARGFPMTVISNRFAIITERKFDMLIIFMHARNLVRFKNYAII